jgi:GNAT superfamily N-acetyltransferase
MGRSFSNFHGITYTYSDMGDLHYIEARSGDKKIGTINWENDTGNITGLHVHPDFRRKGVATGLYNEAVRLSKGSDDIPTPRITSDRSDEGEAWAQSLKQRIPKRKEK